jgi:hypothetical protein
MPWWAFVTYYTPVIITFEFSSGKISNVYSVPFVLDFAQTRALCRWPRVSIISDLGARERHATSATIRFTF